MGLGAQLIPNSGLSIPILPAPRGSQALISATVIPHKYFSGPGEGFSP